MIVSPDVDPRPAPAAAEASRTPAAALDALADALESERRLIDEIAATMRRQRAAVGADDLDAIDDSVFAMHRLLQTLGAARQRRRAVNRLFGAPDDLPISDLESLLGPLMTERIGTARDQLVAAARVLAGEVAINRKVLREAMASGDDFVRTLAGAPDPGAQALAGTYGPATAAPRLAGSLLVDRTV